MPSRPASYADLEAVPSHLVAEILSGELVTHPRPVPRHGVATNAVSGILSGPYQFGMNGPGGWIFADEPELHLGDNVVVPDLAGWRRERLTPAAVEKAYIEVAPDWVLEVLSPSTEKYDKGEKRRIYAAHGVRNLWLLDPRSQSLETFILTDTSWLVGDAYFGTTGVCATPFNAITFPLGLLWPLDPLTQA